MTIILITSHFTPKMEAAWTSEMLVSYRHTTWHQQPRITWIVIVAAAAAATSAIILICIIKMF